MGCGVVRGEPLPPTPAPDSGPLGYPDAQQGSAASDAPQTPAKLPAAPHPQETCEAEAEDWSWCRTVLGRYEVRGADVLGIGNFSIVRRGVDRDSGAVVAVKCLKAEAEPQSKFRRELLLFGELFGNARSGPDEEASADGGLMHLEEAGGGGIVKRGPRSRLLARASTLVEAEQEARHADLSLLPPPADLFVRLLDHSSILVGGVQAQALYTVLELSQLSLHDLVTCCGDLSRKGAKHCLSNDREMCRTLLHITRALLFLHSRLFVHGDLKPANVMWFGGCGGSWKLIDLDGLRTPAEVVDMRDADFYTALYAPPELARAVADAGPLRLSRRLDVWALGATVLELELLSPALWPRFEAMCGAVDDGSEDGADGLAAFMGWLGSSETPIPVPAAPRAARRELLQLLAGSALVPDPALRSSPAELLGLPLLQATAAELAKGGLPPPTLVECLHQARSEPGVAAKPKPPTAWQLYQEVHRAEMQEQGFSGAKLTKELHGGWKRLLAEGGPELEHLRFREAELAASCVEPGDA